ncbi:hypothetical protein NQZ68_032182 [Dissostichus eleginoides]|nr:hypothetical protein NQZ68_032182 [Dissostichus eleginoides]
MGFKSGDSGGVLTQLIPSAAIPAAAALCFGSLSWKKRASGHSRGLGGNTNASGQSSASGHSRGLGGNTSASGQSSASGHSGVGGNTKIGGHT